jgi:hypothetical protein
MFEFGSLELGVAVILLTKYCAEIVARTSVLITQLAIALPTSFSFAIPLQCSISGAVIILSRIWASVMLLYSLTPKYVATNCCSTASSSHVGWENAGDDTARTATANPNIVRTVLPCFFASLAIDIGVASRPLLLNNGVGVQHSILPGMAYPVRGLQPTSQCTAKTHGSCMDRPRVASRK